MRIHAEGDARLDRIFILMVIVISNSTGGGGKKEYQPLVLMNLNYANKK